MSMKWNGKEYVDYDPEDYHSLDLTWFNDRDSHDAEIFWAIHYISGHAKIVIAKAGEDMWRVNLPSSSSWLLEFLEIRDTHSLPRFW